MLAAFRAPVAADFGEFAGNVLDIPEVVIGGGGAVRRLPIDRRLRSAARGQGERAAGTGIGGARVAGIRGSHRFHLVAEGSRRLALSPQHRAL